MISLRIPSLQELSDLFMVPATVSGAVGLLERAHSRVAAVADRCEDLADKASEKVAEFERKILDERRRLDDARAESARASRVAFRLHQLLA